MSKEFYWKLLANPQHVLSWLVVIFVMSVTPLLAVISTILKMFAKLGAHFQPNYGKFLGYIDACMEEEFVTSIPTFSLVTTLVVQNDLSIEELRTIFQKNVLEARCSTDSNLIRYPELKQYLTTFMGFRIWKNDEDFQIENHIVEKPANHWSNSDWDNCENLLTIIHEDLLNTPYHKLRSPWELSLIRSPKPNAKSKTILACRMHHAMADAKSILKLFVECLGAKKLKSAKPQEFNESLLDKLWYYPLFPLNWFLANFPLLSSMIRFHFHPFKVHFFSRDRNFKKLVAFSSKLELADVKRVAKQNGVTGSAVILSTITDCIRKCRKEFEQSELDIVYALPRSNHPEVLTNYAYLGFVSLPTNQADPIQRLKQCNDTFLRARSIRQCRYINFGQSMGGSLFFPLTRLVSNQFVPVGVTNIAGEEEGFSVGDGEVIDFRMSVGTARGATGVVFCVFSYQDGIRIAVIARESVLNRKEVDKLAADIGLERIPF